VHKPVFDTAEMTEKLLKDVLAKEYRHNSPEALPDGLAYNFGKPKHDIVQARA